MLRDTYARGPPVLQEQYTCRLLHAPICPRCADCRVGISRNGPRASNRKLGFYRLGLERMEEAARRTQISYPASLTLE